MKKLILTLLIAVFSIPSSYSFNPQGRDFGFGLKGGEPSGLTFAFAANKATKIQLDIGSSYFGDVRIGGDYLFNLADLAGSNLQFYAGPGVFVGIGDGNDFFYKKRDDDDELGIGARGVGGLNFIPDRYPFEIFLELGLDVGIVPSFGSNFVGALGFRFYP